jgi:TRAP-type C4-dicarboxylate transport system permease small subunit
MKTIILYIDKNFEKILISTLLVLITLLSTLQIIMRYCFLNALPWVEEVVIYMHVWIGFIGCSYAMQHDIALRVDFDSILPPKITQPLKHLADFITVCFYAFIVYIGFGITKDFFIRGYLSPAAQLPMYILYSSLMIGAALAILRWLQRVYLLISRHMQRAEESCTRS